MKNEERYKLFVPLQPPVGDYDHIGPSPAYDADTQQLLGYRVGLYKGRSIKAFHRVEGESEDEIFPIEDWERKRGLALAHLQG